MIFRKTGILFSIIAALAIFSSPLIASERSTSAESSTMYAFSSRQNVGDGERYYDHNRDRYYDDDRVEDSKPGIFSKFSAAGQNVVQRILYFTFHIIDRTLQVYFYIWMAVIIISWLRVFGVIEIDESHQLIAILYRITYGVVDFFSQGRRLIVGPLDLTPMVFLLTISLIRSVILAPLFSFLISLAS